MWIAESLVEIQRVSPFLGIPLDIEVNFTFERNPSAVPFLRPVSIPILENTSHFEAIALHEIAHILLPAHLYRSGLAGKLGAGMRPIYRRWCAAAFVGVAYSSALSIAVLTSLLSGAILASKNFSTVPSRPTRYFEKFQLGF